jgi:hypothetical protein
VDKQQELVEVGGFAEGRMTASLELNYSEQCYYGFSTFEASQAAAERLQSPAYPLNLEHPHEPVNKLFTKSM